MAGTRKNGMKWDRGRRIGRKRERKRRTRASVKTHHSVNNARSKSDSKSGGILRVLPSAREKEGGWMMEKEEEEERTVHPRFHFSNISTFLIIDEAFFVHPSRTLWPRAKITRDSNGFWRLFPRITIGSILQNFTITITNDG